MQEAIGLVVLLPLLGFLAISLLGEAISQRAAAILACAAVGLGFVAALVTFFGVHDPKVVYQYTWIEAGNWRVNFGLLADPLSVYMALIVTGVGFLIHVYSISYMTGAHGEPEEDYRRFFAYMNLFVFTMLLLVTSASFIFLLVGWGGVGLSSFLLIGFYKNKSSAVNAARKALVTNTIGDVGLLLGIFLIIINTGSLDVTQVIFSAPGSDQSWRDGAAMLLLIAAVAKSAQLPLHTWLPDAMEGPTPVSALIHAATMVTAGVYLITRCHGLFAYSEVATIVIPIIGAASAFYAATCALVQTDIKRVLAYSTMSQLGYMFMAAGVGAYEAAMFHLLTHAFFKALLFLTAGAVIHSLDGEQDMRKMGGLGKKMPVARNLFLVGALAISGMPVFSGFFSKEAILGTFPLLGGGAEHWSLNSTALSIFGWVGIIVALMTAFYMFRAFFLVFGGPGPNYHPHKTPATMAVPLYILAALSTVGGFLFVPGVYNLLEDYFSPISKISINNEPVRWLSIDYKVIEWPNLIAAIAVALIGIAAAYMQYANRTKEIPVAPARGFQAFLLFGWFFDRAYDLLIAGPVRWLAGFLTKEADKDVAESLDWGFGGGVWNGSKLIRRTETGYVRNYALGIILGAVAILLYVTIVGFQR